MNKPLIRGRKIIQQLSKDRKFSRSRPPTTVKMTGFDVEEGGHPRGAEDSLQKAEATLRHGLGG
ncbi:Hypothetical protein FKW44_023118, partial [Caligus rogercresseyi]